MTNSEVVPPEVTEKLRAILTEAGVSDNKKLVRRLLETGIGLGVDRTTRLDLKIASAALTEMRDAFALFAPFARTPKVTIFGSARARPDSPAYQQTRHVSAALAERGWMVVTGAGPGIMQAAAEGAGSRSSLGVSIRLPFEEKPNSSIEGSRNVAMKYFFTRKLMLVKESHGFVYVPGGFGTLDELFELLTLQQTGKAEPTPIVLLDEPGGRLWHGLRDFAEGQLLPAGVISPDDFDRVLLTDSVTAAADEITGFWRNYDSLRWADDRLVLRLRAEPTAAEIADLDERFGDLLTSGGFRSRGPLHREIRDDDHLGLPRLVCRFDPFKVGSLYRLIRALNNLDSAPDAARPEQLH
ncbi:TIGR00730 family Rossman fold protein [Acidipropionibacterium jensenii]|uniref:Possible lysine decarboxylase n=2 Tax=Acidipropionibacterium jensenii TaxID=1749 RepID=A0A3Q9UHJ4_9ACTN|nr:TIGR00730 family Rossman fold protein [Acidipropionibacterium jensenii]AZZ42264.1 TIGR00730 family Rossman fold protein [Acidipropionibacterium jensenii]MDN5978068.1 TIGR00730 family Rossman fold protein [Acidipropionibacterium jensenii]MDN5996891.1 TIGR00730 family Rossman fold protein [Acidipropionibacterium jensenii]MDN6442086.1 TIGR00730 family Rossman fold protein [Acidipropionibacterium jensenii]MDN6480878.1 TIGR00730 family Rossman fold protein [Acidipropionibacterium jensenii]